MGTTATPGEQADADPSILLLFEPDQTDANRLIEAIQSHLVGLPVRVVLEPLPRGEILRWFESGHERARERNALGLFAIDTSHRTFWRLYFLDVDGAPTLIRRLRPTPEHAPLDDAGVAVRLLVEALLDVGPFGPADVAAVGRAPPARSATHRTARARERRSSAASTADPQAPPAGAPPSSRAQMTPSDDDQQRRSSGSVHSRPFVLFAGPVTTTWLADRAWQVGAKVGGELRHRAWSFAVGYTWYPSQSVQLAETVVAWSRHPVATQVAYTPFSGFSPRLWLGAWVDGVSRSTLSTRPAHRATSAVTTWSWGPAGGLGIVTPSSWAFSALLDVGAEIATGQVDYVLRSGTSQTLTTTRHVRPVLGLHLGWQL